MDTRSKNYSSFKLSKVIAFILVVFSFTTIVVVGLKTINSYERNIDLFNNPFEDNYYTSTKYDNEVMGVVGDLDILANNYKSEEYIKSGQTINKEEFKRQEENLFNNYLHEKDSYNYYYDNENDYENTKNERLKEEFKEEYKKELEEIQENLIKKDLKDFKNIISKLQNKKGLLYYVRQGKIVFSNTKNNSNDEFKKYPAYVISDENVNLLAPKSYEDKKSNIGHISELEEIKIAFSKDYIREEMSIWKQDRDMIRNASYKLLVLFIVLIISLLYLLWFTGRKGLKDKEVKLSRIDKLYTDINIILIISIIPLWGLISSGIFYSLAKEVSLILIGINSFVSSSLVLMLLLSLVRHLKNKTIISHSLLFIVIKKAYEVGKDIYDSGSVAVKVAVAAIAYPLIAGITFFMFPITITGAVYLAHRKVKEYLKIKKGVETIKNGQIDYKIELEEEGEFKKLAEDINSIGEGFNSAIANELKSEKLKTELITNVSHDIRTPLTSIITYIDLMKNENDPTKINEYIKIIDQKSHRLKTLTDDLFEASKATSGNIPVNFEKIDIRSLITQGLGELNEQVKESGLDFRISRLEEKTYVRADGKLLWRSIENLLTNIFKYSLRGSRVYIDIADLGEEIELSIKNISAYELNISSEELMERFKRGDDSRSSEGSGLGLSISKSLIEAQDGSFDIFIDGDLFKVRMRLVKFFI